MEGIQEAIVLLLAAILDFKIGDPWGWPHPVKVMGGSISILTHWFLAIKAKKWQHRLAGIAIALLLILGSGASAWCIVRVTTLIHPWLGISSESILLASCLAGRSLRSAADEVLQPLMAGKIERACTKLSQYVGRDTERLSADEILRAVLETVAENTTDGVTAPLFYAIMGAFIPGIGSAPLAMAYKAASTLDSTIGYRYPPWTDLGWFSAKLEDVLTWLPCRLTVLTLALLSGTPKRVLAICCRDAPQDPSPNSGWSECVFAAILGVQVGGVNYYQGSVKHKPLLGEVRQPITPQTIENALQLMRTCFLLWWSGAIAVLIAVN